MDPTQPPRNVAYWSRPEYRVAAATLPCWSDGCEGLTTDRWCPACLARRPQAIEGATRWLRSLGYDA